MKYQYIMNSDTVTYHFCNDGASLSILPTKIKTLELGIYIRSLNFFRLCNNIEIDNLIIQASLKDQELRFISTIIISAIDIQAGEYMTDHSMIYLSMMLSVKLRNANNITDRGLRYLTNVQDIGLYRCRKITDNGMIYLSNALSIAIVGCPEVTIDGIKLFRAKNIHFNDRNISYYASAQICNDDLRYFTDLDVITLPHSFNINNKGARYMCNIKDIHYTDCNRPELLSFPASRLRYLTLAKNICLRFQSYSQELMTLSLFNDKTIHVDMTPANKLGINYLRKAEVNVIIDH